MRTLIDMVPHSILFAMVHKTDLLAILEDEVRRHPGMSPADLQKLVFQAAFGGDHMLHDRARMKAGLFREWADLPAGSPASAWPAVQPIHPDGRTARLHLAACKESGISQSDLAEMLWHQRRRCGTGAMFDRLWQEAVLVARCRLSSYFDPAMLLSLGVPDDLPHHSSGYGEAAYRVLNDVTDPATRTTLVEWGFLS